MSRTKRGAKAPGYEYWSRRLGGAPIPGRFSKKRTHKAECIAANDDIQKGLEAMEPSEGEMCFICGRSHPWEPDPETCENYVIDPLAHGGRV